LAPICALLALLGALFLPYSRATGGVSLFHTPGDIAFNVGLLIVVATSAALSIRARTIELSFVMGFVALLWWTPGIVANAVGVIDHQDSFKAGAYFAFVGVGALAYQFAIGISLHKPARKITRESLRLSIGCALGLLWIVGEYFPWQRTVYSSPLTTFKFNGSGTNHFAQSWCTLFSGSYDNADTTHYLPSGVRGLRRCGLVQVQRIGHDVHRSRLTVAERPHRIVQLTSARRVLERASLRVTVRGPRPSSKAGDANTIKNVFTVLFAT
jgi:hypothetical protein